jgi:hypothetical protein
MTMATNPEQKKPAPKRAAVKKPAAARKPAEKPAAKKPASVSPRKDRTRGDEHQPILASFKSRGRDYWNVSLHRDLVAMAGWSKGQRFSAHLGEDGRLVLLPEKATA